MKGARPFARVGRRESGEDCKWLLNLGLGIKFIYERVWIFKFANETFILSLKGSFV